MAGLGDGGGFAHFVLRGWDYSVSSQILRKMARIFHEHSRR